MGHLSEQPVLCDAESCGYRCDREKGHGSLHHHPDPNPDDTHDWWVFWPHNEGERLDMSGRPWTGYLLLADVALPMSRDTGVITDSDVRYMELAVEALGRRFAARGFLPTTPGTRVELGPDGINFHDP